AHVPDLRCALEIATVAYGRVHAEHKAISSRNLDLYPLAQGTKDRHTIQTSLRSFEHHTFLRDPMAGLAQGRRRRQLIPLAEQRGDGGRVEMAMAGRDGDR